MIRQATRLHKKIRPLMIRHKLALAHPIMSVVMYATGDSVVAGLVPATSRRCCGRVFICEISVSASAFFSSYGFHTDSSGAASPKSA